MHILHSVPMDRIHTSWVMHWAVQWGWEGVQAMDTMQQLMGYLAVLVAEGVTGESQFLLVG